MLGLIRNFLISNLEVGALIAKASIQITFLIFGVLDFTLSFTAASDLLATRIAEFSLTLLVSTSSLITFAAIRSQLAPKYQSTHQNLFLTLLVF